MGYLTPILFRNDSAEMLDKAPDQVINVIKQAMNSFEDKSYGVKYYKKRKWYQIWKPKKIFGGADCNPIEALGTRHADQSSVIVFYGNTWVDLSKLVYGQWERHNKSYIEYIESCVKIAQFDLTAIKKRLKDEKEFLAQQDRADPS